MESSTTAMAYNRERDQARKKTKFVLGQDGPQHASPEAQLVYEVMHEGFESTRTAWNDQAPTVGLDIEVDAVIEPVRIFSSHAVILFFPGRMPDAETVGKWLSTLLGGCFVTRVHYAARGFFEVVLQDEKCKATLLEKSPLYFGTQMVHVLPWTPTTDYQALIKHRCPVWVEIVDFPQYLQHLMPQIAASLGKVVCPPRSTGNCNRFCILWDTDVPTPQSYYLNIKNVAMVSAYFRLKWGLFAGACFTCHKFGHMASHCPMAALKMPSPAMPSPSVVKDRASVLPMVKPKSDVMEKTKTSHASVDTTLNSQAKGKEKLTASETWQSPKKPLPARRQMPPRTWTGPQPGHSSPMENSGRGLTWAAVLGDRVLFPEEHDIMPDVLYSADVPQSSGPDTADRMQP